MDDGQGLAGALKVISFQSLMNTHVRRSAALVVLVAVLAPVAVAAPPVNPLAQRLCDALQAAPAKRKGECCGTKPSSLAGLCAQELSASLARRAVRLDAAAVDACVAETSRQLEGCDWVTPVLPRLPDNCREMVHGQIKAGALCRSSLECQDGLFCRGMASGKPGTCERPAPSRTRCETPADSLATFARAEEDGRHLACAGLCIKGQCVPFSPTGGPCQSSAACTPGLHCISGTCQDRPLPGIGGVCTGETSCGAGAYCRAGVCAILKSAGDPCTLPTECRAFQCVLAPGASAGKCGEPCGSQAVTPRPTAPAH